MFLLRRIVRRSRGNRRIVFKNRCQFRIDLPPFRGLIQRGDNRLDRAFRQTGPAVDADVRIDHHEFLALVVAGIDAVHGTDIDTVGVLLSETLLIDDVWHGGSPFLRGGLYDTVYFFGKIKIYSGVALGGDYGTRNGVKAIRIHRHGGPEVLQIDDLPIPDAKGTGYLLIKVRAAAMNHMDLWVRQGMPRMRIPLPIIPGCEGAGVVEECGPGVKNFKKGDEVVITPGTSCGHCQACLEGNDHSCRSYGIYGENEDGTEAEYKSVPERYLIPKPKNLSFEEAASLPLTFLTAWQMLVDRAEAGPGKEVLILAAASGVGSAGVQIAKFFGAHVIATVGSDEKAGRVKELGADEVINHRSQEIVKEVKRLTNNRGADIVFEHVGAATWEKSLGSLAYGGRLVTCGATTGYDVRLDLRHLFIKQQRILGSTMGPRKSLTRIFELASEGKLRAVIDRTFPFSEVREAHRRLESREQLGKIVLVPS